MLKWFANSLGSVQVSFKFMYAIHQIAGEKELMLNVHIGEFVLILLFIGMPLNNSAFGPAKSSIPWINVAGGCTGTEANLYDCPRGPSIDSVSCTHTYVAGVRCYSPSKMNVWCQSDANIIVHM